MGVTELVNSFKRIEYSGFRVCIVVSINRVPITKRIAQKNRKFDNFDLNGYGLQFSILLVIFALILINFWLAIPY